jgi:iron complex outermembrane receptor protein
MAPLRDQLATTSEILDQVPGLHVRDYGSPGTFSTVSIRGSAANQVSVYLDGVPLLRHGLGVANLADLPFAALDRVEVYRGGPPPEFVGAGLGGAINLVTRAIPPGSTLVHRHGLQAGAGSLDTRRGGFSSELAVAGWSGLVVADAMESAGDFQFHDDHGTPLNPADDAEVRRRNNWLRNDEVLLRVARAIGGTGELRVVNQWVRRAHGVPGRSSVQSETARGESTWDLASAELRLPTAWRGRLQLRARLDHEWRRDDFSDRENEIGLGLQDNRDTGRSLGAHLGLRARLPWSLQSDVDLQARTERFLPWRGFPSPHREPEQERSTLGLGIEQRAVLAQRLWLHAGLALERRADRFAGDVRTAYSRQPARPARRTTVAPRGGARVRLAPGLHLRGSYGRYQRAPTFLELFGDGGSIAGSSDLVPEEGTNRDVGALLAVARWGHEARLEATYFHNHVDHLIAFGPGAPDVIVVRNIGAARVRGQEWAWRLAARGAAPRWFVEGSWTRLDATDLGVDIAWYAGKTLPGRPAHELHQQLGFRIGNLELAWNHENLALNYLDRYNLYVVESRDLHGADARLSWGGAALVVGLRNLTDERAADVLGFPLPGRTFFVSTSYEL